MASELAPKQVPTRNLSIDLVKGALVLGMVLAHCIELFGAPGRASDLLTQIVDLGSFSGFLFCFGYASWCAYLSKPTLPLNSILKTALKCYLAFLLSGVGYRLLVSKATFSAATVVDVALLRDLPGFSEFLIAFSLFTLLTALLAPLMRWVTGSPWLLLCAAVPALAATLLSFGSDIPNPVGLLVGGSRFSYFPVVQYLPIFLLGIFWARHQMRFDLRCVALGAALETTFLVLLTVHHSISRFPPSALWLGLSLGLVLLYCPLAEFLRRSRLTPIVLYLNTLGHNVLLYLVLSNLTYFVIKALGMQSTLSFGGSLLVFTVLMTALAFLQSISVDPIRARRALAPT